MPKRFKTCWAAASLASALRAALHDPISSPWTAMEWWCRSVREDVEKHKFYLLATVIDHLF